MMHPGSVLNHNVVEAIRSYSTAAELNGRLTEEQLKIIYEQQWFHLFVPKDFGGLDLSLPDAVLLEESIAYSDGSVGWVVTLCAGAGMFIGYFDKELANEIFADPRVCLAGSGQATGTARIIDEGFQVNGSWPYASGAPHATHFTANCIINDERKVQSFIFKKDEVTLHPNWQYIGLNGTAGYSYSAKDLTVPTNRTFKIYPDFAVLDGPIYRYPFLQLAETTIAANISGMCLYFFDLASELLADKHSNSARFELVKTKALELIGAGLTEINSARESFYAALDTSWQAHLSEAMISAEILATVSRTSRHLAQRSRNLVNELYPYCGLTAARSDAPINQVWRNINTASQHSLLLASE